MNALLQARLDELGDVAPFRPHGQVARVTSSELEVRGLRLRIGDALAIAAKRPAAQSR